MDILTQGICVYCHQETDNVKSYTVEMSVGLIHYLGPIIDVKDGTI